MEKTFSPVQNPDIAWREIDGEAVLVISESSDIKVLNRIGTQIWKQCDGHNEAALIAQEIALQYDVQIEEAITDVLGFLAELRSKGLIS